MVVVVVDVEVNGVQRQPALLVARDDPAHLLLAAESPPRVMVAERPRGGQGGSPGQRGPRVQHARGSPHHHPAAQRTAVHPHLAVPRPVVPGPGTLLALPQDHRAVPGGVVEHQVGAGIRHHQLHRHRQIQRIVAGPERPAGIGVPQPVPAIAQPGPARAPAQAEEPGVRGHLRPLPPPRRTPADRLPPARRQIPPQHHPARRAHLHRAVPRHDDRRPLGDHAPAAVLVRLQHRPRIRLGTAPRERVRRLRTSAVPTPEDRPVHRHEDPQLRAAEPDQPAPRTRLRAPHLTRHPGPLGPPPREPGGIDAPPAPRGPYGTQPLSRPPRTDHTHRTHQVTTVHAAHPATERPTRACRSTAVHPCPDHIFMTWTVWSAPWCRSRSHGIVPVSRVTRTPQPVRGPTPTTRTAREPHQCRPRTPSRSGSPIPSGSPRPASPGSRHGPPNITAPRPRAGTRPCTGGPSTSWTPSGKPSPSGSTYGSRRPTRACSATAPCPAPNGSPEPPSTTPNTPCAPRPTAPTNPPSCTSTRRTSRAR